MNEMVIINTGAGTAPAYTNKTLQKATTDIMKIGETVRKCAYQTAYIMAHVDATECYKDDGFDSVHAWAMKTFGFKKSASYTLLRVGKEYTRTIENSKGKIIGYSSTLCYLDEEYAGEIPEIDFTTTQIEKMLPADRKTVETLVKSGDIRPDMTCKQIAAVIKENTPEKPRKTSAPAETDDAEEPDDTAGDVEHMVIVTDGAGNKYNIPFEIIMKYKM